MTDYMKEAERLLSEYGDAVSDVVGFAQDPAGYSRRVEATRAALLAHIQRGAVPEGWQVVPKEPTEEMLTAASHASMQHLLDCINDPVRYREVGSEEITRKTHASRYRTMLAAAPAPDHFRDAAVEKAWERFEAELQRGQVKGDAAKMTPTPAEVPMPEPVAYLYTLEYGETVAGRRLSEHQLNYPFGVCGSDYLAQTDDGVSYVRQTPLYTKDAEAAGYARGLADAGRDAAAPAPAGVPMPKPVAYGFGNTAITGHTNRLMMVRIDIPGGDQYAGAFWLPLVLADEAHTYGVACRAAGEAAGYARGLRDAVRDADIEALRLYVRALCKAVDAATDFIGTVAGGASWWDDVWADHAAALDRARERISQAALRGEVKP